jgi:predicted nucleotidyltransferase
MAQLWLRAARQGRSMEEEARTILWQGAARLVDSRRGWEVWLFGSWARGDWDSRSDVGLIAVAPRVEAWLRQIGGLFRA